MEGTKSISNMIKRQYSELSPCPVRALISSLRGNGTRIYCDHLTVNKYHTREREFIKGRSPLFWGGIFFFFFLDLKNSRHFLEGDERIITDRVLAGFVSRVTRVKTFSNLVKLGKRSYYGARKDPLSLSLLHITLSWKIWLYSQTRKCGSDRE